MRELQASAPDGTHAILFHCTNDGFVRAAAALICEHRPHWLVRAFVIR